MRKRAAAALAAISLATLAQAQETITYSYDAHGRLVRAARAGSVNNGITTQYDHDIADNRARRWINTGTPPSPPVAPPPAFSISDASAPEGWANVFTITRHGSIASSYTVNYATAAGTAASGTDFTSASGTLTFGPDDYVRTVSIPTVQDSAFEANETFSLNLSGASGGATIIDSQGLGTIVNDDSSNVSPVANPDTASTEICGSVYVNVVANDTDPDANYPLSLVGIYSTTSGSALVTSATTLMYSASGWNGFSYVVYIVQDSLGAQSFGTLTVTVTGEPPCL